MLTCETSESLILREVDGLLAAEELAALEAHAAGCEACRRRRQASLDVARALARRAEAPVPAGFAARVVARAFPEAPPGLLDVINWRRWTARMLPVAAAFLVVAVVAGGSAVTTTGATEEAGADSSAVAIDVWSWSGESDTTTGMPAVGADVSDEDLLATMLGSAASEKEGKSDGR
jgi:anti-sigma factor RsiW